MQGGGHLQTHGVQGNKKHWTEPPTKRQRVGIQPQARPNDHRLAQSLRSTERFQKKHHSVLSSSHPKMLSVGDPSDSNFRIKLGEPKEKNTLMGTAIRPNESLAKTTANARECFSPRSLEEVRLEDLSTTELAENASFPLPAGTGNDDPHHYNSDVQKFLDVATAKFPSPIEHYGNYPMGHNRYLKSPHAPHSFFSCGAGLRHLHEERLSPIVYMTDPLASTEFAAQVNHGMLMVHV